MLLATASVLPLWKKSLSINFIEILALRYEQQDVALNSGMILRECLRFEPLAKLMVNSEKFFDLFNYVELSTFDVASDAFSTFKVW